MLLGKTSIAVLFLCVALPGWTAEEPVRNPNQWAHWRGPLMNGVAPLATPPVEWSEEKNIRWKTRLPGLGHSTPVVWNDLVFLTAARPTGDPLPEPIPDRAPGAHDNLMVSSRHEYLALAVNRKDGSILWERSLDVALPHEGGHNTGSLASHSPTTDGERYFAFFGSRGLYCLDAEGAVLWQKDLGTLHSKHGHGEGSSPVLYGEHLVVNWDHEEQSFIVAFDKRTGKEVWRKQRDELTSWSSPIVVEHEGRHQVVANGTQRVRAYDLSTGETIWECGGLSANVVASPVASDGIVIFGSSYEKQAMLAVQLDGARGDITGTDQVLWSLRRSTPYVPSPLLYDDVVYFLRHYQNILSRVDIRTGENRGGPFRLGDLRNIYASPVGADGRIYVTSREGLTMVISHSEEPEFLGMNYLEDSFSASAVLVGSELMLRGERYLYNIMDSEKTEETEEEGSR